MKKSKSIKLRQVSALSAQKEKLDDGVLAIPTPREERAKSHAEMQAFIKRIKEQNDKP